MKSIVVMMALTCICIGVSFGMGDKANKEKTPDAWGPAKDGCRLALKASQSRYRFDQPIALQMTLKNDGNSNVRIGLLDSILDMYRVDVRLPSGAAAPLTLEGKRLWSMGATDQTLSPGEMAVETIPMLNRLYDMTLSGEYTVTVSRLQVYPVKGKVIEVVSNTIKIVVADDAASTMPAKAPAKKASGARRSPGDGQE